MKPLPAHVCTATYLQVLLARLGIRREAPDFVEAVRVLLSSVAPVPGRAHRYRVGEATVVVEAGAPPETLASRIENGWRLEGDPTAHRAAVAVVLAYQDPRWRAVFDAPLWEVRLQQVLDGLEAPEVAERERGWVRYHLRPAAEAPWDWPRDTLFVERFVVRMTRAGDRERKPVRCPDDLEGLGLAGISETDLRIHGLERELYALAEGVGRYGWGTNAAWHERFKGLLRQVFEALRSVGDLRYDGRPIRCSPGRFRPRIDVLPGVDGALELVFRPEVEAVWAGPLPTVLTRAGELVLLPQRTSAASVAALAQGLPSIPSEDVDRFLAQFVGRSPVPIEVPTAGLTTVSEPEATRLLILIAEREEEICVRSAFSVELEGAASVVEPGAGRALVRVGERFVRRDLDREAALLALLGEVLPSGLPAWYRGDDALDFLHEQVPRLAAVAEVRHDGGRRVVGCLTPRVEASADLDWFDLRVVFEVGDDEVSLQRVLEAWRRGDRYLAVGPERMAQLPLDWLERHGEATLQLEEVRGRARLGRHAMLLVQPLLTEAVNGAQWLEEAERVRSFRGITPRPAPPGLTAELRSYQRVGWSWLAAMTDLGLGVCLADDMGLGKTVQMLAALVAVHEAPGGPSLVVCPRSVLGTWLGEAERFAPGLVVRGHHGPSRSGRFDEADVYVTTYGTARSDIAGLAEVPWRFVVLDEAQTIKNPDSAVARAMRGLKARRRVALTGTPLENNLVELWSLFQFLNPGFFGSRATFRERFVHPIRRGDPDALASLRDRIRPFVLRRLKQEVAPELPERSEIIVRCALGPAQRALYEQVRDAVRLELLAREGGTTMHVLEALTRLRQVCCDPSLVPLESAQRVGEPAKLKRLAALLDELVAGGHRTLVFSQWPSVLRRAAEALREKGVESLYLDGATRRRHALVEAWNAETGPPVFFISLKAGGTGLTLTGADRVVHLDPWWNPAVEAQATDRAHRIGQTRRVTAYKFVATDTVEEKMLTLQRRKRALFESTVDAERLVATELTRADLEAVLGGAPEAAPADPVAVRSSMADRGRVVRLPEVVESHLERCGSVRMRDVRELLGCSEAQARRVVAAAVRHGVLQREGTGSATRYTRLGGR